ncbi:UvrD-helicase domain-containing protein [Fundidesulfovibrio agrisoli]|uniref:UvrD-helicase domain-containing protein n=1 Tax=Fundidesulfovibrio agrisoli TaxID=2922717 RepID=UPI001FAB4611|nr:UvrD-helicase domain-containing protein [Fundidesulfovibrio agrisoli]
MIEQLHASAGSGKTYRLTRRFLGLLMASGGSAPSCGPVPGQGYGPESILAITFTNKAAAEMKERVLAALKTLALGQPDPDFKASDARIVARSWLERTLRHLQTLNIRTIDSLLNQLARLFALELGLPPDFETSLDEDMVFEALHDAVNARSAGPDPQLEELTARMADALTILEGRDGFWLAGKVEARLRQVFGHLLDNPEAPACDPAALNARLEAMQAELSANSGKLRQAMLAGGVKPMAAFETLLAGLVSGRPLASLSDSAYAAKSSLDQSVRVNTQAQITPDMEALFQAFRASYLTAKTQGALLSKALAWQPFLEFGALLMEAFEAYRRDKALALLSQLPGQVARLLDEGGGVPEAYCRMGSRLNHLLIDEFQDTSVSQWDVLKELAVECLSKGGSLFYVGDVKQAIYSWRGGEAELFERAAASPELTRLAQPRREVLAHNWRSAAEIVGFNNTVFSALEDPEVCARVARAMLSGASMAAEGDFARSLCESFQGCAQELPPGREPAGGFVRILRLEADTPGEYTAQARQAFEELFRDELSVRRDWSEIAVLTRTNGQAALAAQWLVDMGIPVVTENSLRLAEHPVVQGAVSFLAFLDYPPDNMALWGFLSCRELFCRSQLLDRDALSDWLAAQSAGPLHRKFQRDFPEAWQRLVEPFLRGAGPASPYDLVHELFSACGVFEAYPDDEVFLRRFLELVHNAETQGHGSLSAFLEFWRAKGREEKIPQPEDARAVRVLTIHKAKGLEFPVAVAPFHLFSAPPDTELCSAECQGLALTLPLCKELGEPYHAARARTLLEQINLLYVAWTRPEQELHLFLHSGEKLANRYPLAKAVDIIFEAAGIPVGEHEVAFGAPLPSQAALLPASPPQQAAQPAPQPQEPLQASPPLDWLPGLKIARSELGDPEQRLRLSERVRGVVAHKALELLALPEDASDAAGLEREALRAVRQALAFCGLQDESLEPALAENLAWLAAQPFYAQGRHLGLREAEIMDEDGTVHRPDLIVFAPTQTLVIDYKTGREDPAHALQVQRYLRLVQALPACEGRPARGILAYLDQRLVREILPEASR